MPNHRVVKKSEKSQSSKSPARFGGNASETASVGAGLKATKSGRKQGKLKQKGLNKGMDKDQDKYEYYTSEDEHGRRIQKMRKKKRKSAISKERSADKRPPTDRRIATTGQNFG